LSRASQPAKPLQEEVNTLRSQIVTLKRGRGRHPKYLPYAFTEHGATMVATILNSPRAIEMSIHVVRAFVQTRELLSSNKEPARRFAQLETSLSQPLDCSRMSLVRPERLLRGFAARPPLRSGSPPRLAQSGLTNPETWQRSHGCDRLC